MKANILHSIAVCLTAVVLLSMVACGSQDEFLPDYDSDATLLINVEPVSSMSRASVSSPGDNEKMHSVRIVILHPDGRVEHNMFYALDGPQEQRDILLKVAPSEKKKVFLFANEESVDEVEGAKGGKMSLSQFLDSYTEGTSGFEKDVNDIYFQPDYTKAIPMSSEYGVDIPAQGTVKRDFNVVRVATKFILKFKNMRGDNVTVESFSLANYADKNYLMGHVEDTKQNEELLNGMDWIDWLKKVSDASSENDSYETTEAAGWLKDYDLPAEANKSLTYSHPQPVVVPQAVKYGSNIDDIRPGEATTAFYLPESVNLKEGTQDGEQEYTLTVNVDGASLVSKLPNLKALFRNTCVVVNITMYHNLEFSVDVIPFTDVALNPDYGLERDDFTGYIVGKDKEGRRCWYYKGAGPYYLGPTGKENQFVKITGLPNGDPNNEYLLVYTDFERTAKNLDHFYEKNTRKKHLLTPEAITGYVYWNDMYLDEMNNRYWIDPGGDPDEPDYDQQGHPNAYLSLKQVGLNLLCCRILYEWDRLDWNKARWWLWPGIYPKYWYDVLGNRYPWTVEETEADRRKILGDWVNYLE